jgi:hypothetical protein
VVDALTVVVERRLALPGSLHAVVVLLD